MAFASLKRSLSLQEGDSRGTYEQVPLNNTDQTYHTNTDQVNHSAEKEKPNEESLYNQRNMEEVHCEVEAINYSSVNNEVGNVQNHCKRSRRTWILLAIVIFLNVCSIGLLVEMLQQGGSQENSHNLTALGNTSNQVASDFNITIPKLKEENKVTTIKTDDSTSDCLASMKYTKQISKELYTPEECKPIPGNSDSVFCPEKELLIPKKCLCAKHLKVCKGMTADQLSCGDTGKYDCAGQDNPCQNQGFLERCDDGYCQKITHCDSSHELLLSHTKCNCQQTDYTGDFCHLPKVLQCSDCEGDLCLNLKFCNSTFKDYPCLNTVGTTVMKCSRKTAASSTLPVCGAPASSTSTTLTKVETTTTSAIKKEFLKAGNDVTKSKLSDKKPLEYDINLIYILPYALTTVFVFLIWISYMAKYKLLCFMCDLPKVFFEIGVSSSLLMMTVSCISYGMLLMHILRKPNAKEWAFLLLNFIQMLISAFYVFFKLIRRHEKKKDHIDEVPL